MNLKQFICCQCGDQVILDLDQFPPNVEDMVFAVLCTPCLERGMEEGRQVRVPSPDGPE